MMNEKMVRVACVALLLVTKAAVAKEIIPQPLHVAKGAGVFQVDPKVTVHANQALEELDYLIQVLADDFGWDPMRGQSMSSEGIQLVLKTEAKATHGDEGYQLQVNRQGIRIEGATRAGIFYGIQTLRQLVEKKGNTWQIGFVEIKDRPRFGWRSYLLDEGRYFQGKAVVKNLLDEMALLKMNTFHWHLTEDQGWRLAIEKYPLLATVGGRRDSSQIGGWNSPLYDGKPHEGYYTTADIKEIIAYASDRHIKVVPEIEMPGHASAAIAAYPWLGVTKQPITVPTSFGVKYDVFDVTDPQVIRFLQDVLDEVIALFPSDVIHIGGDEVKYDHWLASAKVQAYMKQHRLTSPADLQIAFTNDISNYIAGKGRKMMGWNDIMGAKLHEYNADAAPVTGKLAESTIIHFWKGDLDMVKDAVSKGYRIVNSYHVFTYLDYDYASIPLEKAYGFDPIPEGLDSKYHSQILGLGCQMWGEWTPTEDVVYEMTFPRLAAYAEVGWTPNERKDFGRFRQALADFSVPGLLAERTVNNR